MFDLNESLNADCVLHAIGCGLRILSRTILQASYLKIGFLYYINNTTNYMNQESDKISYKHSLVDEGHIKNSTG